MLLRWFATAPLIHLATHAVAFDGRDRALNSYIALTPGGGTDGFLTLQEIRDQVPKLRASLVVLSACQTGLGDVTRAEGVLGFGRALLGRGAGSVLASLWNVNDAKTGQLMEAFCRHWRGANTCRTKAEAHPHHLRRRAA